MRDEVSIAAYIADLRRDINDLKLRQLMPGKAVKPHLVQTANTWDYNATIASGFTTIDFYLVADNQDAPLASWHPTILVDGVPLDPSPGALELVTFPFYTIARAKAAGLDPNRIAGCTYRVYSSTSRNLKIKVQAVCSDSGQIVGPL